MAAPGQPLLLAGKAVGVAGHGENGHLPCAPTRKGETWEPHLPAASPWGEQAGTKLRHQEGWAAPGPWAAQALVGAREGPGESWIFRGQQQCPQNWSLPSERTGGWDCEGVAFMPA